MLSKVFCVLGIRQANSDLFAAICAVLKSEYGWESEEPLEKVAADLLNLMKVGADVMQSAGEQSTKAPNNGPEDPKLRTGLSTPLGDMAYRFFKKKHLDLTKGKFIQIRD